MNFSKKNIAIWNSNGLMARAICLSLMSHFAVLWFSSKSEHPIFSEIEEQAINEAKFQVSVKVKYGEVFNSVSQANISEQSPETNSIQATSSSESLTYAAPHNAQTETTPATPTLTSRPIGYFKASPWGGRFVNTTQVLMHKTTKFIYQLEPVLVDSEFTGRCVIYLGPSDFLASIRCSASQEHVSLIMNTLNQHFRLTSELTEYWRCIDITNSTASIKEKCDAL